MPAEELAALYAERWEIEIGLDEIETHQMGAGSLLRSKKPELVEQEIWALLITHYAIRHLMHEAAETIDIDEDMLSFIRSLRVVQRSITNEGNFPPRRNLEILTEALNEIAKKPNPPRRARTYPRVVKRRADGAKLTKRQQHRQARFSESPKIKIKHLAAA